MLYFESNLASDKGCVWTFQQIISLDNTSEDGVLLRYNPYRNLQAQCLEYVYATKTFFKIIIIIT
jgi:hypothetical protein